MRRWMAAAAAAIGLGIFPAEQAQAQADVALVYRLLQDGEMLVSPAAGPPRRAQLGERLRHRDEVATSANTRAALRFTDDGSILRLNPSSQVRLIAGEDGSPVVRTLELEFGEVWARVNRRGGAEFRVETPAGVAAVKGTELLVRVDSQGVTTVITLGGRRELTAGRKAVAESQTDPPEATPATREELREAADVGGGESGEATVEGAWIEVLVQDAAGRTRTLMIQVPRDALRTRLEGQP
jgi:hypothetical protein